MHNEIVPNQMHRRHFIGGSDARIVMGDDQTALPRLWREKRSDVERGDRSDNLIIPLGLATENLNRRWYEAIAGGVPLGWYIVTVCYAIAVISLGWWPWNFLLLLLLFPIRNKRARFYGFRTTRSNGPMRPRMSCTHGSSL